MNNRFTVLIVEDEKNILNFIATSFTANDYKVLMAINGTRGLMLASSFCPDLIILDLGLSDMDGMEFIQQVRSWSTIPIIVVSARSQESEKVKALDLGADDYVTKPFGVPELMARARTALRHQHQAGDKKGATRGKFTCGEMVIDYEKRHVYIRNEDVHLTQNEYKIVAFLSLHAGKVMTYAQIIRNIWGPHASCDTQILRVHMANIRRKIEVNPAQPSYIFTEIQVGYRMQDGKEE